MVSRFARQITGSGLAGLIACVALQAQAVSQTGQVPVLPAVVDPQADFAPGVARSTTPGVKVPEVVKMVDPTYSNSASRAGIQGTVILDAIVGVDGLIETTRVRCTLESTLDAQAQKALSEWRFKPAQLNGAPTRFVVQVEMEFRQHQSGKPLPPNPRAGRTSCI